VKQEEASQSVAMSTRGGIEFREVLEDESMFNFQLKSRDHKDTDLVAPGVHVSADFWRPEDRPSRSTNYLIADQSAQLTDAFAQLRARGWRQPPHCIIAFGREPRTDDKTQPVQWRSYLLGDQVLLDGDAVEGAAPSLDP